MKHLLIFICVLALAGCGTPADSGQGVFTVALWNVQTLFDGEESGFEYSDFRDEWGPEKYQARLTSLSKAIASMPEVPDLIGFTEIENAAVLEDLSRAALLKHGYNYAAFTNLSGSGLGIGFLSRFPLTEVRAHSITIDKETAPRPVLEVRIEPEGEPLVFLLCHWKSKLGGDYATEALRRASARVVYRRLSEIKAADSDTPVIVMGDFNLNHDDFYRRSIILCALLPDDPDAALLAAGVHPPDFLVLSSEKPPRTDYFPEDIHVLYSPWDKEMTGGSYYYRGAWESIDNFLLSTALFNGTGWEFADSLVLNQEPFITSEGIPNRYINRSGRGLSDHLPLILFLQKN